MQVRLLLSHRANVHAADARGLRPMHWAADKGHADAVRQLLATSSSSSSSSSCSSCSSSVALDERASGGGSNGGGATCDGAPPPLADGDAANNTPLHLAAANGDLTTVELLLRLGAPVCALNAAGETPRLRVPERCGAVRDALERAERAAQ